MKLYRFLTGPDDSSFCHRISKALNEGWQLHGNPSLTFDTQKGRMICAQAVIKEVSGDYSEDLVLSEQ